MAVLRDGQTGCVCNILVSNPAIKPKVSFSTCDLSLMAKKSTRRKEVMETNNSPDVSIEGVDARDVDGASASSDDSQSDAVVVPRIPVAEPLGLEKDDELSAIVATGVVAGHATRWNQTH